MRRTAMCPYRLLFVLLALAAATVCFAEIVEVPLKNASFEEGADENGVPVGWSRYAGAGQDQELRLVDLGEAEGHALVIEDGDPTAEIGVTQSVAIEPGLTYQVTVSVRSVEGASTSGAYLQFRLLPSNEYKQTSLAAGSAEKFDEVSLIATTPPDTKSATIYLYCHAGPTPKVVVDNVKLVSGVEPPPPPPPPPPEPVPPVYDKLKRLHLETDLVTEGKAAVTIVVPASGVYREPAAAIQQAIEKLTGVKVPVVTDEASEAAVPLQGNLIVLGNRSTNGTISALYDRFYTLLDLKYPGPQGYVVRTLHSPFGDGSNVIFVGGSDTAGVEAGAQVLVDRLAETNAKANELRVGWLAEIKLGEGVEVPTELADFKIWEESKTYGSVGYFGWNIISKRMAMYYMTGDEFQAREFLRLSFPGEREIKEIEEADGERIENKHDPLAGPYHYSAHMMMLFWDLIEESPVFSDEDRLRVTNAFSRQLTHRAREGIYGKTSHPGHVGNRHGDWAAMSLYVLARYFQKDYSNPIWQCALDSVKLYFSALADSAWLAGNNDHLFWYTSYYDPMLDYICMSGDRTGLETGNLQKALRTQDVLFIGGDPDWGVRASSLNYLHRAAYLAGDGRFLFYRDRTGLDTDVFRLGQAYWPDESLKPKPPTELLDTWTIQEMPEPMWAARGKPVPLETAFLWGSYRNTLEGSGDFLLIKGHNGGGRNPYHTFVPLELRLNGSTLLKGYHTQVLTSADGMVEPQVAMDSQLVHHDVLGGTVVAVGETPKAAFCNWRRTLAQRVGQHVLFVDDLGFRTDSENVKVLTEWQTVGGAWNTAENMVSIKGSAGSSLPPGWRQVRALDVECTCGPGTAEELLSRLTSINMMLLKAKEPGTWIEMLFELPQAVTGEVFAELLNYKDRGIVRLYLDGEQVGEDYDHYAPAVVTEHVPLGRHELAAGEHRLRFEIVGKRPESERMYGGLIGVTIRPEGAPDAEARPVFELHPSDLMHASGGGVVTMQWLGTAKQGQHRIFFHLLGQKDSTDEQALGCYRLAENAAALALPEPGLAVVGEFGATEAELAIWAGDHLYGQGVIAAGSEPALLRSDVPVDVDWDFSSGALHVAAGTDAEVAIALEAPEQVKLDGEPAQGSETKDGLRSFALPAGRHVFEAARPSAEVRKLLASSLAQVVESGRVQRAQLVAATGQEEKPAVPELTEVLAADIGAKPVASLTYASAQGEILCLAEGNTVHVLGADGTEVRTLETDGEIRVMRWWEEHKLLLVGCKDEKVIAFEESGERRWVFVSEMDRAVWEAAKQYWFKSAHPGIYGLHTGVFLDGKSQCFIGSACALEIIDERGQLVKRMPIFWGPGWEFLLVDGPNDTINLLVARWPNGTDTVAIVNNETLKVGRGFYGVPAGHTMVGGWAAQNRTALFYEDLDGDGVKEIASATNGVWNRVTVFSATGTPLHNAQFGPGSKSAYANLRDMQVADLDGDGTKEMLIATSGGLVVALDHKCEKVWAKRTPSPPTVLRAVIPKGADTPQVFVGCEDGTVAVLDARGEVIRTGKVSGRVVRMEAMAAAGGAAVVLATDKGEVRGFRAGE